MAVWCSGNALHLNQGAHVSSIGQVPTTLRTFVVIHGLLTRILELYTEAVKMM
jgi:hypothetical protein